MKTIIMKSNDLIDSLLEQTKRNISAAEQLRLLDIPVLTWKASAESWSILECIEHLNRYGKYYLPEIEKGIGNSSAGSDEHFSSGWLGNYFAKSMLPKEKLNKMKTFKDKDPLNANLDKSVINTFIEQHHQLSELLHQSRHVSLNKVRIPTSIAKFIRLKLGDTFRFVINHNLRHIAQAEQVQRLVPKTVIGIPAGL